MPYLFKNDFVTPHENNWRRCLAEFAGKPSLNLLEVGSQEGRSAIWFLENILTHETSSITCIDLFFSEIFYNNISKFAKKVRLLRGDSSFLLRHEFFLNPVYDIIYIDGGHHASEVLSDAILSFTSLRIGGVLIFDDYLWKQTYEYVDRTLELSEERIRRLEPKIAIDSFIDVYSDNFDIVHKGYQVIIRKKELANIYNKLG
jgi:predicted O-methyltransferase YrrM